MVLTGLKQNEDVYRSLELLPKIIMNYIHPSSMNVRDIRLANAKKKLMMHIKKDNTIRGDSLRDHNIQNLNTTELSDISRRDADIDDDLENELSAMDTEVVKDEVELEEIEELQDMPTIG